MKRKNSLSLEMMIKNFYFFTIFALIIGGITYYTVKGIGREVSSLKNGEIPLLVASQDIQMNLEAIAVEVDGLFSAKTPEDKAAHLDAINTMKTAFNRGLGETMKFATAEESPVIEELNAKSKALFKFFEHADINRDDVVISLSDVMTALVSFQMRSLKTIESKFSASEAASLRAITIINGLTFLAVVGMITLGLILSRKVGKPVSTETEKLISSSRDIEKVFGDISEGTRKQTDVVKEATSELEDMIINIIQGSISVNVDKQSEIARAFADFLKNFVERTTVEIAMGTMSISQQSKDARKGIEDFIREVSTVEANIRDQEAAIEGMVNALKTIVDANKEIKEKAKSATDAVDKATAQARSGQERIGVISDQLQKIRNSSEGVKEITDSLAKITESIKILALNMSLKVEDIRDDTGKTYGFEAMTAKVQKLAEEVDNLLGRSRSMIIPTIQGIEKVSIDAADTRELISEIAMSINIADVQSKSIAAKIDKQAADIDMVEIEAEKLKTLAQKTTAAVEAQGGLARDVDGLLKDSEILIEGVNSQTLEAAEGAKKVNQLMGQLRQSVSTVEDGTGRLIEKSSQLSDMFESIRGFAAQNMSDAKRLEDVTSTVIEVSNRLSEVVKGQSI